MWKHFTQACAETKALECALEKHSNFNTNAQKIIVKLIEICLNNVVTQYGDQLYTQKNGIVTGDNHSVSLANVAVHYILQPITGVLPEAALSRRFIDDIIWITTSKLPTSTNFSICQQWFGTNVSPSLDSRSKGWSWIPRC